VITINIKIRYGVSNKANTINKNEKSAILLLFTSE
jgi:hypothetical protein